MNSKTIALEMELIALYEVGKISRETLDRLMKHVEALK